MNPRELVRKTLMFETPERIPRQLWLLPWAEDHFPQHVRKLQNRFPDDIVAAPTVYKKPLRIQGDRYKIGTYVDEWGCTFDNVHGGVIGIVHKPLIQKWEDLKDFKLPEEVLSLDKETVDAFCKRTDRFVIAGSVVRPFERLQFIRTTEQALIDVAEQPPDLFELLSRIHEHYKKEVEVWAQTDIDAVSLMDDWGVQKSLFVSPHTFRRIFKPMYQDYVEIARQYGKYVFFHSDGYITDIIPDFIDVGIDAINSQIFCMGIKELGEKFSGKITFWGEIDRQHLLPHGTQEDIQRAVREVYQHLYADGGVIAQCEFGPGARPENVFTVFETWEDIGSRTDKE